MGKKILKSTLLATIVTAVLSAGTVSARQLRQTATTTTCQGFCTKKTGCPNILGCACVFNNPGATVGKCSFIAAKPAK